jgi:hypothetical protein
MALIGLLWGFTLKCDDSCSAPPPWRDDPNAWQWNALGAVALGGFVCSAVFVAAIALRWRTVASAVLVSWGVLAAAFLMLFDSSGLTSHVERGWLGLAALAMCGLAAIALSLRR